MLTFRVLALRRSLTKGFKSLETSALESVYGGQINLTVHKKKRSTIHLTLKITSAQVVETSVKVTSNSPSQDYTHPDDHNLRTYDMTPGFKPFTIVHKTKHSLSETFLISFH